MTTSLTELENTHSHGQHGQLNVRNSSHMLQHGLTNSDGTMNRRSIALTASQQSDLEQWEQLSVYSVSQKRERIWVEKDYETTGLIGEYVFKDCEGFNIKLNKIDDMKKAVQLALSSLRLAEPDVIVKHLTRLMLHKHMSNKSQIEVSKLIEDYARVLSVYAEYAVILAVDSIIKTDKKPFLPQLAEIIDKAKYEQNRLIAIHDAIVSRRNARNMPPALEAPQAPINREEEKRQAEIQRRRTVMAKPREKWNETDWQDYINEAHRMAKAFRNSILPDVHAEWVLEIEKRTSEKETALRSD